MKITIDTTLKEVSLESYENLKELTDFMQKHFPEEWINFKIKGESIVVTIPYQETTPIYNPPFYTYVTNGFFKEN